jgi:hypothetical protein
MLHNWESFNEDKGEKKVEKLIDSRVLVSVITWEGQLIKATKAYIVLDRSYRIGLKKSNVEDVYINGQKISYYKITKIVDAEDTDIEYAAGIDINGSLFAVYKNEKGEVLGENGSPLLDEYGKVWNINYVYNDPYYVDIIPTGHVNIKIDRDLVKRIKRFSSKLGRADGSFMDVLRNRFNKLINGIGDANLDIQSKISIIILLKYLVEIKDQIDASSAGFAFESFLAGMISDSKVADDNSPYDIIVNVGGFEKTVQIKLVDYKTKYIKLSDYESDYYLIGIKNLNKIILCLLSSDKNDPDRIPHYGSISVDSGLKMDSMLNDSKMIRFEFDLSKLDDRLDDISQGLREQIGSIFDKISKLEFDVETIITGVDEKGDIVDLDSLGGISNRVVGNTDSIGKEVSDLIKKLAK